MQDSIFKGRAIGNMGGRPIDRAYIERVRQRGLELERVCNPKKPVSPIIDSVSKRGQLSLIKYCASLKDWR